MELLLSENGDIEICDWFFQLLFNTDLRVPLRTIYIYSISSGIKTLLDSLCLAIKNIFCIRFKIIFLKESLSSVINLSQISCHYWNPAWISFFGLLRFLLDLDHGIRTIICELKFDFGEEMVVHTC